LVGDVHITSQAHVVELSTADITGDALKLITDPTAKAPRRQRQAADAHDAVIRLTADAVGPTRGYLQTDIYPRWLAARRREAKRWIPDADQQAPLMRCHVYAHFSFLNHPLCRLARFGRSLRRTLPCESASAPGRRRNRRFLPDRTPNTLPVLRPRA